MKTYVFKGREMDAAQCIEEAKKIVIIAAEARDQGLEEALSIVRASMARPGTCKHPGKVLSKAAEKRNSELNKIVEAIRARLAEDFPF